MKKGNIVKLSCKNLFHNFSRSALTFVTLILLSSVIILLCNFCYYFKKTTDSEILNDINSYGIFVTLTIKTDRNNNALIEKISVEDIHNFIKRAEDLDIIGRYEIRYKEIDSNLNLQPYIGGYRETMHGDQLWNKQDRNKNHIWISKEYAQSENIAIGDTIKVTSIGQEFIVKGITDTLSSFIDYSYFDITSIYIYGSDKQYDDYSIIKKLSELVKTAPKNIDIHEGSLDYIGFYFVLGISIFLALFSTIFSLGNIINILKISIEDNNYSIGLMKCLGMKKHDVLLYILTQLFVLILLSTIFSTLLSWLITKYTLILQISVVTKIFQYGENSVKVGFNFLMPLLNLFILGISVLLASLKILRRYSKTNVIQIIRETA